MISKDNFRLMDERFSDVKIRFDDFDKRFQTLEKRFDDIKWTFGGASARSPSVPTLSGPAMRNAVPSDVYYRLRLSTSTNWSNCGRRCMNRTNAKIVTTNRQIDAALAQARRFAASDRRVLRASYEKKPDLISLYLDDGIRLSIPRMKLEGLESAECEKVAKIEILGRGTGLHWPLLNVDHYVPGLLNRVFGTSRWMSELGRRGGSATTKAKGAAARANGQKGGRPKKRVA
jgi:Protein of unknown function (DUF2442)